MKTILAALAGGLMLVAAPLTLAQSKPAAKPAAAAPKGPTADEKAMDRAAANYKKNKAALDAKGAGK